METESTLHARKTGKSFLSRSYDFLAGFHLATVLLLVLLLLTWLATLEQIDQGLHYTLNKYFSWKSPYIIPTINGKIVPVLLPGGYYVCALLLVNMILGGVVRIRKTPLQIGNLIAHFGIIFMLIAGGVAHHFEIRGNMAIGEGEMSDVAEDYTEYVIEVAEVIDGKRETFHVIRGEFLTDLKNGKNRTFDFEGIPFSLVIGGYSKNVAPVSIGDRAPEKGELVADGFYLFENEPEKEAERNIAGAYGKYVLENGEVSDPFIITAASFHPQTIKVGERLFTVDMRKRLWPMPFQVKLDKFTADFHPGTSRPAEFISDIRRVENGQESTVRIEMNEPMRYEGLTFFQASYGPEGAKPGEKMYSIFEIVRNPADKWPEYSLYIVAVGMLITFLTKLFGHLSAAARKRNQHG